jgi:hypothetical protein
MVLLLRFHQRALPLFLLFIGIAPVLSLLQPRLVRFDTVAQTIKGTLPMSKANGADTDYCVTDTTDADALESIIRPVLVDPSLLVDNENDSDSDSIEPESVGFTDEEFEAWFAHELLESSPLSSIYTDLFHQAPKAIVKWRQRFRGDPKLWKRIFKKDKVIKELLECIPIIDALQHWIVHHQNVTIIDLASGKGYLSMLLSELLPPDRVTKIVLMDKQWPMCHDDMKPHHINWSHIYGYKDGGPYYTWPIRLVTSKQDLKQSTALKQVTARFLQRAPVAVLAVHLCGTLSLRAIDICNQSENVQFVALKPCCLPAWNRRDETFSLGNYSFAANDVVARGAWNHKQWYGPPRWHLQKRFAAWAEHLLRGIDVKHKIKTNVLVQTNGGYQNTFLFAEREPTTRAMWVRLEETVELNGAIMSSREIRSSET